jgi:hypothetical protein
MTTDFTEQNTTTAKEFGFAPVTTGGGCMAFIKYLDEDGNDQMLVTDYEDGAYIDGDPDAVEWGGGRMLWDDAGECDFTNPEKPYTLRDALAAALALPPIEKS